MSKRKQDKNFMKVNDLKLETLAQSEAEPVSIVEAAKSLKVSQRTVWNYIKKGWLDKVTIGGKVYVPLGSIERLARSEKPPSVPEKPGQIQPAAAVVDAIVAPSSNRAVVEVSYLEELCTRIGQLQADKQALLEWQANLGDEKEELAAAQARLVKLQTQEAGAQSRAVMLEKENKYLRIILWILVGVGLGLIMGTLALLIKGSGS
jgi:hypothetical protein